jgi:signal peptidase I
MVIPVKEPLVLEHFRYSDDVREAIALATRLARKSNRQTVSDRDYLGGLLQIHRRFNRLDSLFRELEVSAAQLRGQLKNTENVPPPGPTSDLLKNAELIAQGGQNGAPAGGNSGRGVITVELEHLLKAFCLSADPLVSRIFTDHRISPDRIDASVVQARSKHARRSTLFLLKELAEVVVFVLVFLILIKSFLGELRLIPSESMVPGLQVQDRLVIERVTRWVRPYQRGDILVFYPPMTQLKQDPWSVFLRLTGFSGLMYKKEENIDVAYIKRLIGLPGDTVEVRPGIGVFVNGQKLDEPYVNEIANTCTIVQPAPEQDLMPTCGSVKVAPGHYFMMGDNRNMSLDSRYWGFAEQERVIGRAVFRVWPLERAGSLPAPPYQHDETQR